MAARKTRRKSHPPKKSREEGPPLPRPFWSGTISFGLVSVPVNLFPASRNLAVRLRMLAADGTPLARRFYCPEENVDVHAEHILRGYEVSPGEYVIVRDEELQALRPRESRDIDLRRFVPIEQIPPLYFERAYFLTPAGESTKAYRLLAAVMEQTGQAGIGTFVMREREYLVAILAEAGILRAQLLRQADEVRAPGDAGLPEMKKKPDAKRVAHFRQAIRKLSDRALDRDELQTEYAAKLQKLVERKLKASRDVVEAPDYEEDEFDDVEEAPIDLLEAIRRSLRGERPKERTAEGRSRHGRSDSTRHKVDRSEKLEGESKEALYERAQRLDIPGRSRMSKQQLIRALRRAT